MEGSAKRRISENDGIATSASYSHPSTEGGGTALSSGYDYEVFLSFRGPDTRSGFTDFLYTSLTDAGIRTFKDDEDLRKGEEFAPELLQAIKQSKISIPIFSKNYASSAWCLKEVVQMVECKKTGRQKIMPIFYDVAPSEVRHQTDGYGEAFSSHKNKKRYDQETIKAWEDALNAIPAIGGWDLYSMSDSKREGQLVKTIVQKIFGELKKAYLLVSKCLVNVDNHVDAIMELIGAQTSETRIIGIHGMGGIGKTTITKIIYNLLLSDFENCCFLPDIREMSARKGIEYLQHQLISGILKNKCTDTRTIDDGSMTMKDRLSNKRVLLLLDDMHEKREMDALVGERNWFGKGSKIIITTRNKQILDVSKVDNCYELMGMDHDQSLKLFSKHAFRRDSPLDEYIDQCNKVIDIAKGLPLALEVIGSLLSQLEKKKWNDILEKLENVPPTEVRRNLKISYDALEDEQKHIFLDIACLFIGYKKDDMVHFWEKSKYFPELAMDDLQNRSLIKIEEDNIVWMHDQLRDLGRDIVRKESNMKIEMQRSVWDPEEASNLLRKHKGKKRVEALRLELDGQKPYRFSYESFESLSDLRFLEVDCRRGNFHVEERLLWHESPSDVFQTNENSDLLPQLRWLSWCHIPPTFNITNFLMEDVVILNLSQSKITDDWKGWSHMKVMKNLKVLDLSSCEDLQRTPIFSSHPNLERLILRNCRSLIEIDASICQLIWLVSLDISDCGKLRRLPDELGRRLANLKFLSLSGCWSLERLPDSIGNLESLIELIISDTQIEELSDSIGNLKELKVVEMDSSNLSKIPDVLWSMGNLEKIIASGLTRYGGDGNRYFHVNIGSGIHRSQSLTTLTLMSSDIYELPRLPESLIKLQLSELRMDAFPDLSYLTNLKEMDLHFGQPHHRVTDTIWGVLVRTCPWHRIGLGELEPPHVTPSPTNLALPPSLDSLRLCRFNLHHLPRPPSTLSSLHLENCAWFFSMEDLSNLKKLSSLHIQHTAIAEIQGLGCLENLRSLELCRLGQVKVLSDLTNLNKLTSLTVDSCDNLDEIQREPQSLEELTIRSCKSLRKLHNLSSSTSLPKVEIDGCDDLVEIQAELPPSLKVLEISSCESLRKLPNLSRLIGLHTLDIRCCNNLVEIQGELPQSLELLTIFRCGFLQKLPYLSSLARLQKVDIDSCNNLVEIQGELSQSLELRRFYIKSCDNVVEIPIELPQYLENLMIRSCKSLQKLPYLSSLMRLQQVSISRCNNLVEIQGELPQSLQLKIYDSVSLQKLPYSSSLMGLGTVCIEDCDNLVEIPGFRLQSLERLEISECKSLQKLPYLLMTKLRMLFIDHCNDLVEIQDELPQSLELLYICGCQSLQELPNLSSLKRLQEVHIECCGKLNVQAISSLCLEKSIKFVGERPMNSESEYFDDSKVDE